MAQRSTLSLVAVLAAILALPPASVAAASPTITGFSPTSGPVGTLVVISGANLSTVASVTFNTVPATIKSKTATTLKAVVPATNSGKLKVFGPNGSATSGATFTRDAWHRGVAGAPETNRRGAISQGRDSRRAERWSSSSTGPARP